MKFKNTCSFFAWILVMQFVLWLLSVGSVSLLFHGIDGVVELVSLSSLVLCGLWGYILSKRTKIDHFKPIIILFIIWTFVPAVLIYFAHNSGIGWTLSVPYRAVAQTLFSSYFSNHQSAFELNVLQPLLIACSYMLTLLALGLGVYINQRDKSNRAT